MWCYDPKSTEGWRFIETKPVTTKRKEIIGPVALSHHTITVIGNYGYLFGGSMGTESNPNVFRLDLSSLQWELLPSNLQIDARDDHTAIALNEKILIFGGFNRGERTNKLLVYNTENYQLDKIEIKGSLPKPRNAHTAVEYKKKMYIYGGKDEDGKKLSDLWCFDFNMNSW